MDAGRGRTPPRMPLLAEAIRRALSCAARRFDFSDARKRSAHARVSRDFFWVSYAIVDVLWSDGSPAPHSEPFWPEAPRLQPATPEGLREAKREHVRELRALQTRVQGQCVLCLDAPAEVPSGFTWPVVPET